MEIMGIFLKFLFVCSKTFDQFCIHLNVPFCSDILHRTDEEKHSISSATHHFRGTECFL